MTAYDFTPGHLPLLVSIPHAGTALTPEVESGLSAEGKLLTDTDWHVPRLYDFLQSLGANILVGRYSRYVVDLNRPADDKPLYNTATTGLFPEVMFDGTPLFDKAPSKAHRDYCFEQVWQPYHKRLSAELERLHQMFGYALLFDAHSIRSIVPRLFEGRLPDLSLGTNEGQSCDSELSKQLISVCGSVTEYSHVLNDRFKGGYITRHYGLPERQIHAVQLELAQCNYMEEQPPFEYRPDLALPLKKLLCSLIGVMISWGQESHG